MKVLILHSLPPAAAGDGRVTAEFDLHGSARLVSEVLPDATVAGVQGDPLEILQVLEARGPDVVFNLCEAPHGRAELEPHVAALLEWRGQRFTGSGSETLALCRRKDRAKAVLAAAGVPVPGGAGRFPCILKPLDQDGSVGIDRGSVCRDAGEVQERLARETRPVLIEEFLPGREFVVSLWGAHHPEHFAIAEFVFRDGLRLNTYASKWRPGHADYAGVDIRYDALEPALRAAVLEAARGAWLALGVRGYARVDLRCDAGGTPRVLDVNPNPALAPGEGLHRAVLTAGWSWQQFVQCQVEWAE